MKSYISIIILVALFSLSSYAQESHYIRANASGNNSGADWTNAWTELPSTLVRGDTYYLADGTYGAYTFDDAESGSTYIHIRKATEDDHGTGVGWNNTFGDGQADFKAETPGENQPIIRFRTSYWEFDGVVGEGETISSYGFKVTPVNPNRKNYLLGVPGVGDKNLVLSHIAVRHTALILFGSDYDRVQIGIYSNQTTNAKTTNIEIANNHFRDGGSNMVIRRWENCSIHDNYWTGNWSSPSHHGQQISPGNECNDIDFYNNVFRKSKTFVIGCHINNNYRWRVYNNIVIDSDLSAVFSSADSGHMDVCKSWQVHHNTIIDSACSRGIVFVGNLSDPNKDYSYVYNNLMYNCNNPRFDNAECQSNAIRADYNAFFDCSGNMSNEPNDQIGTGNPFIGSGDYHLLQDTDPGKNDLGAPYNIDLDGMTRGADGIWDRGAFEFDLSSLDPPGGFHIEP